MALSSSPVPEGSSAIIQTFSSPNCAKKVVLGESQVSLLVFPLPHAPPVPLHADLTGRTRFGIASFSRIFFLREGIFLEKLQHLSYTCLCPSLVAAPGMLNPVIPALEPSGLIHAHPTPAGQLRQAWTAKEYMSPLLGAQSVLGRTLTCPKEGSLLKLGPRCRPQCFRPQRLWATARSVGGSGCEVGASGIPGAMVVSTGAFLRVSELSAGLPPSLRKDPAGT